MIETKVNTTLVRLPDNVDMEKEVGITIEEPLFVLQHFSNFFGMILYHYDDILKQFPDIEKMYGTKEKIVLAIFYKKINVTLTEVIDVLSKEGEKPKKKK